MTYAAKSSEEKADPTLWCHHSHVSLVKLEMKESAVFDYQISLVTL